MTVTARPITRTPGRFTEADCSLPDLAALVDQTTELADFPYATAVEKNVLVYDASALRRVIASGEGRLELEAELVRALTSGPGVVAFQGAFEDHEVIDRATSAFDEIIAAERAAGGGHNDHFAKAGANDRIWNALEKLAVRDPGTFVDYYGNDILALISTAWLGPAYQMTSQVNVVRPGGQAQDPHRDYHLGFLSNETAARYPAQVHLLSPVLTLQGAVAHSDMPIESGPTMYLPYSQKFEAGYIAFNLPEFREYFVDNYIQLPLEEGDAVFFNPALFHAAGHNTSTDIYRMANLLQVSSPFGRAMDSVDRMAIGSSLYSTLLDWARSGRGREVDNVVAASAEGYAFPSNLDLDQPITGLAGETHAELLKRAVDTGMTQQEFDDAADALYTRHQA